MKKPIITYTINDNTNNLDDCDHIWININTIVSTVFLDNSTRINPYGGKHLSVANKDYVNSFYKVDGIIAISLDSYRITIKKGGMFSWSLIMPKVIKIIKKRIEENLR